MRIIAGKRKGLPLKAPKGYDTRPTSDRVKEAMFNMIQGYERDAHVLDLFAGTGALGLEALSRGAKSAVFVEKNIAPWRILLSNIAKAGFQAQSTVFKTDALLFLKQYQGEPFDLIFVDPPYGSEVENYLLTSILTKGLLAPSGLLIYERGAQDKPFQITSGFKITKEKAYGDTVLLILGQTKEE